MTQRHGTVMLFAVVAVILATAVGCDLLPGQTAVPPQVLVIALGSDADGVEVPVTILDVRLGNRVSLRAVNPFTSVTVLGTSYDTLRDAYPFGGGRGVAQALARTENTDAAPFVVIALDDAVAIMSDAGGVDVSLSSGLNVFSNGVLYSLPPGDETYRDADLRALLLGIDYLEGAERADVLGSIAAGLADGLSASPAAGDVLADGGASTDLSDEALAALAERLKGASITFEGFAP